MQQNQHICTWELSLPKLHFIKIYAIICVKAIPHESCGSIHKVNVSLNCTKILCCMAGNVPSYVPQRCKPAFVRGCLKYYFKSRRIFYGENFWYRWSERTCKLTANL